jgi:acyl-CoA thioesterase FadM
MVRIQLELPAEFCFRTSLTVRVTDLNYGNHLGNDAVLGMVHEARVRWFASMGYSELEVEGVGILMADCAIVYKSQGFLGERLTVAVAVGTFSRTGCDLFYRLTKADGTELARAKTGIVFFDYQAQTVRAVPEGFRNRWKR